MSSKPSASPKAKARSHHVFKRTVVGLLVIANLLVGLIYWRLTTVQAAVRDNATQDEEVVGVLDETEGGSDPVTFLVVGSDSREGLDNLQNFGPAAGQRSDVMILLRIYPEEGRAAMLSLPRDLWVSVEGHGEQKLNAAYAFGGSSLLVSTIKEELGVEVNHYVEVDFVGFKAIVDELGGVVIDFPYDARDTKSGLSVSAGEQTLMGDQALAYVRSRSYQELRDGAWTSVDANDIGRTRRQQMLLLAILSAAKRPSNIAEAGSISGAFAQHLTLDADLANDSLVELGWKMRDIRGSDIEAATLPTFGDMVGEASVLRRDEPAATAMIEAFISGAPMIAAASGPLRLVVLNGNGVSGAAGRAAEALEGYGFDIVKVGDADRKDFVTTVVIVRPSDVARAEDLVATLGFGEVRSGTVEDGVDAVVIVGSDFGV